MSDIWHLEMIFRNFASIQKMFEGELWDGV